MTVDRAPVHPTAAEDLAARIDADTACVVVQNPDVLNCGPMPFSKLVMKHNGTRWQIDAESDAEEEIDT